MVATKLVIKKNVNHERDEFIFDSFLNEYGFDLFESVLSKNSDCGQHQIIYTFFSTEMVDFLIDLFIESDVSIIKREDCTSEIVSLIVNGELQSFKDEFDYILDFDNIMEVFSKHDVVINTILDKVSMLGKDSLTENQISILKNAS